MQNPKALGLALIAMLVAGAIFAGAAQAAPATFRAGNYPASTSLASGATYWSYSGEIYCGETSGSGWMTAANGALHLNLAYSSCTSSMGWIYSVVPNGCTDNWSVSKLEAGGAATGKETIKCPAGKALELLRYKSAAAMEQNEPTCVWAFSPQGPVSGVSFQNQGSGSTATVSVSANVSLSAKVTYGGATLCGGSVGSTVNFQRVNSTSVSAYKGGANAGISFGSPGSGVFMAGEASAEPSKQPGIEAETGSEALTVFGSLDAAHPQLMTNGVREISCSAVSLSGNVVGRSKELALDGAYEGCTGNAATTATIAMNTCHYTLNVLNAGPPYQGSLGVACSKEGDGLELSVKAVNGTQICLFRVPAQTAVSGVGLTTAGSGDERAVSLSLELNGLQYTTLSGTKANCGKGEGTFKYTGGEILAGV